jgi:hypothetical protein
MRQQINKVNGLNDLTKPSRERQRFMLMTWLCALHFRLRQGLRVIPIAGAACFVAAAQPSADQWHQDLQFLAAQLPAQDSNFFAHVTAADFSNAVAQIDATIPNMTSSQIVVALAQLVALGGDGHTSLSLTQAAAQFRAYPLALYWFREGMYATAVGPLSAVPVLGKRLTRIGGTTLDDAIAKVSAAISHDTDQWIRFKVPAYLVLPELLAATGITPDATQAQFTFDNGDGTETAVTLTPVAFGSPLGFRVPHAALPLNPLYQRNGDFYYWAEYLADSQTLYIKYNNCSEDPTLKFADFTAGVLAIIDNNQVARVILDLRNNEGGNTAVIAPLLAGFADRLSRGILPMSTVAAVIIGRETFSSAVLNAVQLKQNGAMLVGETAGWNPNGFGEVHSLTLPYSGLIVSYSTRKFSPGVAGSSLNPDVPVDVMWADYAAERDAFLAAAVAIQAPSEAPAVPSIRFPAMDGER